MKRLRHILQSKHLIKIITIIIFIITLLYTNYYPFKSKYTKDDKESYQYVEKTLNVKPTEILHIGDTLKSDYLKPIENGWNALFYGVSDDESVNCISSLMELYDFFDIRTSKK